MLKAFQTKLYDAINDDKPITAIQVIENLEKCPAGFYPISRTYDQDQDADLGESSIFKSSARYLCVSKTEGLPNFVVQDLRVLNDKTNLPQGFSLIDKTADTAQKPWKKKQLCYCLGNQRVVKTAVTNIIVCSRVKKAPPGFSFAGEVRGITICYKMGNVQEGEAKPTPPERPPRPTSMSPGSNPMYPALGESDHDYEILKPGPMGPSRPAPPRPPTVPVVPHQNSTHTLNNTYSSLDGVPFIVNPKFLSNSSDNRVLFPIIKAKTRQQIMKEYDYPFIVERQS